MSEAHRPIGPPRRVRWRYGALGVVLLAIIGAVAFGFSYTAAQSTRNDRLEGDVRTLAGQVRQLGGTPAVSAPPGPAGPAGQQGVPGQQGAPGASGRQGPPGPVGQGQQGPPGVLGPTGPPGAAGAAGQPGQDGTPGQDGQAGPQGDPGPPGEQGPRGEPGSAPATVYCQPPGGLGNGGPWTCTTNPPPE